MKKNIKLSDYKHIILKNWYVMILVMVVAMYMGPVTLSKYNGEVFLYEKIITDYFEICAILMIFSTLWIFKPLLKEKEIDKSDILTRLFVIETLVIVPLIIVSGVFLSESFLSFEIGSISLIIIRLLGILVILNAVMYTVCYLILKMATWWEATIYTVLLFALPYVIYSTIELFMLIFVSGYPVILESEILGLVSPISALISINYSGAYKYGIEFFISYWFIIICIIHYSFNKLITGRNLKKEKMDFANSKISQVITIFLTSTVLVLLGLIQLIRIYSTKQEIELKYLILPILGTLVIFIILASLQNRKLMKLRDNFVNLGVICVITGIVISLAYFTKGFGMGETIPDVEDISHITAVTVLPRDYDALSTWDIYPYVRITDKDSIAEIIKFHESVIRDLTINNEILPVRESEPFFLNLTYYKENGDNVARTYYLNEHQYDQLKELQYTQDILKQSEPLFENKVKKISVYNDVFTHGINLENHIGELMDAYLQDLSRITYENSKSEDNLVRYNIVYSMDTLKYIDDYGNYQEKVNDFDYFYQIIVDDRYVNTVEFIKNLKEPSYLVNFEYSIFDDSIDSENIIKDGRVKRTQDLHFKVSDFIAYEKQVGEIERYQNRLLNIYDKNKTYDKLFIEGKDGDLRIKTLIPISNDN
ncbi:MAG: hypothetical protein RR565_08725 [Erysipelothrix sp.]